MLLSFDLLPFYVRRRKLFWRKHFNCYFRLCIYDGFYMHKMGQRIWYANFSGGLYTYGFFYTNNGILDKLDWLYQMIMHLRGILTYTKSIQRVWKNKCSNRLCMSDEFLHALSVVSVHGTPTTGGLCIYDDFTFNKCRQRV